MKKHFIPLLIAACAAVPCPAQTILTPYTFTTIVGQVQVDGMGSYQDGTNGDARFNAPSGVAVDQQGNLYVADRYNQVIRLVTPLGSNNWATSDLAGNGNAGHADGAWDVAEFFNPEGVAVDNQGNVYVADTGNHEIREITPDGTTTTIAGFVELDPSGAQLGGYVDGPGFVAQFDEPTSVAVDNNTGNLYVADYNNGVIRKLALAASGTYWEVSTLAGGPPGTSPTDSPVSMDGKGPGAVFNGPHGVAVDGAGNVYVAEEDGCLIRKITPDGVVTTLAGSGTTAAQDNAAFQLGIPFGNLDGQGRAAQFNLPFAVAVDAATNVYVSDTYNSEIRKVTPDGRVTTLGGVPVFNPDAITSALVPVPMEGEYANGTGTGARFDFPKGLAVDLAGNLYVADEANNVIREGVAQVAQVVALEVTQVIQDWSNSVPLIQGKNTYVRAHMQLAPATLGSVIVSGARLYGYNTTTGDPLPNSPTFPINSGGSLTVQTQNAADPGVRGTFAKSLNFQLPPEWLSGSIKVQLAWSGGLQPTNVVAEDASTMVTFIPAAMPQVKFFAVNWTNAAGLPSVVNKNTLSNLQQRVLSCYPVTNVTAQFATLPWTSTTQPDLKTVNTMLLALRPGGGNQIYYGAIFPISFSGLTQTGLAPGAPSSFSSGYVRFGNGEGWQTVSHEIGHNLGRYHDVNSFLFGLAANGNPAGACGEDNWVSYTYPLFQPFDVNQYPKGAPTLGPMTQGSNSLVYGLDTLTLRNYDSEPVLSPTNSNGGEMDPNCYFDLMSYCRNGGPEDVWPSVVTYTNLLNAILGKFGSPAPMPTPVPQGGIGGGLGGGVGNYLLARGLVDFNAGTAQFLPCLALTTTNVPPAPPPGTNFLLQALDASGTVLQTIQFALEPNIVEEGDTNQAAAFLAPFTADPAIHVFQLSYNGAPLDALTASPHAPTVTLTAPNGGQNFATNPVSVAWSGSDADGDALTYTVQYSADGGATWETRAVDWPGQSLDIDSAELAATTNGLIRVTASDGFNMAGAQSAAPFTVLPHAPALSINSPRDGSVFMSDQQLFLDASANDMQDGVLGGTNVQWYSDRDGALGSGTIVTFDAIQLSEGYHTITVTAIDRAGLTNSAVTHLRELHHPPPQLSIVVSKAQTNATLSWPSYYTNYVLQSSAGLASGWVALTNTPTTAYQQTYQQTVQVGLSKGNLFYRLMLRP